MYKINKKFYYIAGLVMSLPIMVGCTNTQDDWTTKVVSLSTVTGLEDCNLITVNRGNYTPSIQVVRCGDAKTTSMTQTSGKTKKQINLIEDGNLEKVDTEIERLTAYKKEFEAIKRKYGVEK